MTLLHLIVCSWTSSEPCLLRLLACSKLHRHQTFVPYKTLQDNGGCRCGCSSARSSSTGSLSLWVGCFLVGSLQIGTGQSYSDNAFELLHIGMRECSLQTRGEALALRTEVVSRTYTHIPHLLVRRPMAPWWSTQFAIWRQRSKGIEVTDPDSLAVLVKSLPAPCV